MKSWIICIAVFSCLGVQAQDSVRYSYLLQSTEELILSDSIQINVSPIQKKRLDTLAVKKWFSPLLGTINNNRLKNRNYYLTGKITANPNFDLLILMEEKKRSDSSSGQVIYLVSTKKDGTYISSLQAAIAGSKKKSSYNTYSCLYKNNKLVLNSKMTINEKVYADLTNYKINGTGRFILYPKTE